MSNYMFGATLDWDRTEWDKNAFFLTKNRKIGQD